MRFGSVLFCSGLNKCFGSFFLDHLPYKSGCRRTLAALSGQPESVGLNRYGTNC